MSCCASAKWSAQGPETYINTELTEPKLVLDRMAPYADTDTRTGLSASQLSGAKGMKVAG